MRVVESIAVCLLLNAVASAPIYYVYDENPDTGYGESIGSAGSYKNRLNNHKKYFIGSNNQKYTKLVNERAIDSHFTVQKTPTKPYVINEKGKVFEINEGTKSSQNYKRRANEEVLTNNNEPHHVTASTKKDIKYQDKYRTTRVDNFQSYSPQNGFKYKPREYVRDGEIIHDKKHNFVSVNAHKAAVSKEDKVVVKNNNKQFIHQPMGYNHKIAGPGVRDLNKSTVTNDRNLHLASHNTNGFTQNFDLNSQKMYSKKRDTVKIQPSLHNNVKQTSVSDKMKKFMHKDINNYKEYKNAVVPSRSGNHAVIIDRNDTPYALFYKINSEHLDQEVLIENPLAEPTNNAYGDRMTWNIENEAQEDSIKTKSKRAPNVKMHKRVRNHSYRSR